MPHQTPPLHRTLLEYISINGNSLPHTTLREEEAGHWCICHNDRRIICGKEARVSFLSKEALGVGSVYWGECTTQTVCFQSLDFWSFLSGISALFVWNSLVLIFPACANKAWSCPICCLLKGEHVCRDFQEMESPCTKPGLQDKDGTHWILCHNYSRSLAVKKAKVDFLSEVTLGLVWAHGLDDIVEKGSLQTILVVFLKWLYCPFLTTSYVFLIPDMEKKVFSGQIRLLLKEIMFGMSFIGWKHNAWNQWSDIEALHWLISCNV